MYQQRNTSSMPIPFTPIVKELMDKTMLSTLIYHNDDNISLSKNGRIYNIEYIKLRKGDRNRIYKCVRNRTLDKGSIYMNKIQMNDLGCQVETNVDNCEIISKEKLCGIDKIIFDIELVNKDRLQSNYDYSITTLVNKLKQELFGFVFLETQQFIFRDNEAIYKIYVEKISNNGGLVINERTDIIIKMDGQINSNKTQTILKQANFKEVGIGGLDKELDEIIRRAFLSRLYPKNIVKQLGIRHVKGLILYGLPGCGKTLIARQIGKMLNVDDKNVKVVNGPEIFNMYVGNSEENIRNLFKDAENDQRVKGEDSPLHLLIFDELDSICKKRGTGSTGGTGTGDNVVNQLLSKMDGVEQLNNLLIIGMTNRLDLIDNALMRPNRFEVHMEIGLPNLEGRKQILEIHTKYLRDNGVLKNDINLNEIAIMMENYTGAEIEGVIRSATSHALKRNVNLNRINEPNMQKEMHDINNVIITRLDLINAINELKPANGNMDKEIERILKHNNIINYNTEYLNIINNTVKTMELFKKIQYENIWRLLIIGDKGVGKTTLACKIACDSKYKYVKIINASNLLNQNKYNNIIEIFNNTRNSENSLVILDNIEDLIEYIQLGNSYNPTILHLLLNIIEKREENKVVIIGTTRKPDIINNLGFGDKFDSVIKLNKLNKDDIGRILKAKNITNININKIEDNISIKDLLLKIGFEMNNDMDIY